LFRKAVLATIVAVGIAVVATFFVDRSRYSHQQIKACFNDVGGLRAASAVRIAGVEVGTVRSVRANTQNKDCPAEVVMDLATTYEIKIPADSIAGIGQEGVLGPIYVDIDVRQATGPPVEQYGYLRSKPIPPAASVVDQLKTVELMLKLVEASKAVDNAASKANASSPSGKPQTHKKP